MDKRVLLVVLSCVVGASGCFAGEISKEAYLYAQPQKEELYQHIQEQVGIHEELAPLFSMATRWMFVQKKPSAHDKKLMRKLLGEVQNNSVMTDDYKKRMKAFLEGPLRPSLRTGHKWGIAAVGGLSLAALVTAAVVVASGRWPVTSHPRSGSSKNAVNGIDSPDVSGVVTTPSAVVATGALREMLPSPAPLSVSPVVATHPLPRHAAPVATPSFETALPASEMEVADTLPPFSLGAATSATPTPSSSSPEGAGEVAGAGAASITSVGDTVDESLFLTDEEFNRSFRDFHKKGALRRQGTKTFGVYREFQATSYSDGEMGEGLLPAKGRPIIGDFLDPQERMSSENSKTVPKGIAKSFGEIGKAMRANGITISSCALITIEGASVCVVRDYNARYYFLLLSRAAPFFFQVDPIVANTFQKGASTVHPLHIITDKDVISNYFSPQSE